AALKIGPKQAKKRRQQRRKANLFTPHNVELDRQIARIKTLKTDTSYARQSVVNVVHRLARPSTVWRRLLRG
ncbi:MAG: hypothetical protein NXI32_23900, partial [bacterium]|nr:hypothetical protein [bacterium]